MISSVNYANHMGEDILGLPSICISYFVHVFFGTFSQIKLQSIAWQFSQSEQSGWQPNQSVNKSIAGALFPVQAVTSHTKTSPTQILGGPVFEAHLELLKSPWPFFRLQVHNLKILKIVDLPGMSFSSVVPFHNLTSILVCWFSQPQENRPQIGLAE